MFSIYCNVGFPNETIKSSAGKLFSDALKKILHASVCAL
jgi:hypothetical protein